jgi:hypothetical protein
MAIENSSYIIDDNNNDVPIKNCDIMSYLSKIVIFQFANCENCEITRG